MCTRQFKSKPTYKNYQFRPRSLPEYNEKKILYSDSEFKNRISTKYMCVLDNRCVIMY